MLVPTVSRTWSCAVTVLSQPDPSSHLGRAWSWPSCHRPNAPTSSWIDATRSTACVLGEPNSCVAETIEPRPYVNYSPMLRRPLWFSAFSDSFCWRENVLSLLTKCFIDWIKVLIDATLENYSNKNIMKHPNTTRCNKSKLWIETSSSSRKKKQN